MYSNQDGQSILDSRQSFADGVSIKIKTGKMNCCTQSKVSMQNMAVSVDGQRVAVSPSSGNVVHIYDIHTGKELGRFATGYQPHENIYFAGGTKILNAAMGNVETTMDAQGQDFTKVKPFITIADANKL